MFSKQIFKLANYNVELTVPPENLNGCSLKNNIDVYDHDGVYLWNISELLKVYSAKNGLKYYDELYFDIRLLDNHNIFCIGFNNHCEVNLKNKSITKLINNR